MGGVATDLHGTTSFKGLYAAGEVAAAGIHGANRLASNSLLEGLVFGARAAAAMLESRREFKSHLPKASNSPAGHVAVHAGRNDREAEEAHLSPQRVLNEVRSILWNRVGIIRNGKDLCDAVQQLNSLRLVYPQATSRQFYEARNILEVARTITQSALARQESRGAHYRSDFPLKDEAAPAKHSFTAMDSPVFFA